jgi:Cu-Zn family superoxide dismutase
MKYIILPFSVFCMILLSACDAPDTDGNSRETDLQASVVLHSLQESGISGNMEFKQKGNTVSVTGLVSGLQPNSKHAFHIHEVGDCGNNGENAGEHFNPLKTPHGKFGDLPHHAGDFPQIEADENGRASVDFTAETMSLSEPKLNVLGRALIVHAGEDKYTQPSGDAGARIACGVIEKKR